MRKRNFFHKAQQKRYASRSYRNPYFRTKPSRVPLWWMIGGGGVFVLTLIGFVLLFTHSTFRVALVRVHGIQYIDQTEIASVITQYTKQRAGLFFTRGNRFLFDTQTLADQLNAKFTFRELTVEQQGVEIDIRAIERTSQLLWQSGDQLAVVDLEGVITRFIDQKESVFLAQRLPLFVDRNQVTVELGDQVMTAQEIEAIFHFQELLQMQFIPFEQTEFDRLAGKWVGVVTQDGYTILFDPTGAIDEQAARLHTLLEGKLKDRGKLEYIDLRFGDHVYFKER